MDFMEILPSCSHFIYQAIAYPPSDTILNNYLVPSQDQVNNLKLMYKYAPFLATLFLYTAETLKSDCEETYPTPEALALAWKQCLAAVKIKWKLEIATQDLVNIFSQKVIPRRYDRPLEFIIYLNEAHTLTWEGELDSEGLLAKDNQPQLVGKCLVILAQQSAISCFLPSSRLPLGYLIAHGHPVPVLVFLNHMFNQKCCCSMNSVDLITAMHHGSLQNPLYDSSTSQLAFRIQNCAEEVPILVKPQTVMPAQEDLPVLS
ncbi:uncharacterized protein EV420DRAFT_1473605 [Desarmillaria tabescens]|uniref:Uncharacterized protein n=1 Tax=Armillaria tabescens TaxID=1929756 RepID=A0AA39NLC0_ARMTA|nr:uncharacterized protein EV420DRAFT_1473605 [Desarmillaria tabescens]KAK0467763.1 hypothetical protein EV420DRAFT_1473605 [Desarmillaria tabescens]